MALGLRPRQNVVILAETRQEWMVTAQACLRLNIPVVTLYATLGEEGIVHGTLTRRGFRPRFRESFPT